MNPANATASYLEDGLTRIGTFGVLLAGVVALLMLAL
jgi:hypothetical protein